jgi:hypothetical protein
MSTRTSEHVGVDLWSRVLSKEGAVALIAVVLVAWLTGSVDASFRDLNAQMHAMRDEHANLLQTQRELAHYAKATCLAVADDETERALCVYREP